MKIINVKKLISQKIYSGEETFDYDAPKDLISIPYVDYDGVCKVSISYWILEDDSVEVKGKVSVSLKGQCSRCLKMTTGSFTEEICCYYAPEGKKFEEEDYSYANGELDFEECVKDAIMLGMPFALLCKNDCEEIPYES